MSNLFMGNAVTVAEATTANTSYFGGATLVIFQGTQPTNCGITAATQLSTTSPPTWSGNTQTILAVFTLPASGSNTVVPFTTVNGGAILTFGSISSTTAVASGTANWFRILSGATVSGVGNIISVKGTELMDGVCGTSGADLNLNAVSVVSGATVSISSFVITIPN